MASPLQGKVAIITGASSGIGAAIARELHAAGVRLALTGRRIERLEAAAAEMPGTVIEPGDVTDAGLFQRLLERARQQWGRIDIVVNNAGELTTAPVETMDLEALRQMVRVNVEAAYQIAYEAVREFRRTGSGDLLNLSSVLATKVRLTAGAYSGTKAAIESLSEALRMGLAGSGIRVSCLEPGLVLTELHRNVPVHPREPLGLQRPLEPADVARAARWLLEQPAHVLIPRLMILASEQPI